MQSSTGHNSRIVCWRLLPPHLDQRGLSPFLFGGRLVSVVCFKDTFSPEPNQRRGDITFVVWELPRINVAAI